MSEEQKIIEINTAGLDELTNIPGIGSTTAKKIIAGRPYSTIDDLRVISGIGDVVVERIAPFIQVTPPELELVEKTEEPSIPGSQNDSEVDTSRDEEMEEKSDVIISQDHEPTEVIEESLVEDFEEPVPESLSQPPESETIPEEIKLEDSISVQQESEPTTPPFIEQVKIETGQKNSSVAHPGRISTPTSQNQVFGISLTCGVVSVLISIALTLGILFMINNSLEFIKPSELSKTEQKLSDVSSMTSSLAREIKTLTTRLDNLESISGRVDSVEKELEEARADMKSLNTAVEMVQGKIDELDQQMKQLQENSTRFSAFLDGLKSLLESLSIPTSSEN